MAGPKLQGCILLLVTYSWTWGMYFSWARAKWFLIHCIRLLFDIHVSCVYGTEEKFERKRWIYCVFIILLWNEIDLIKIWATLVWCKAILKIIWPWKLICGSNVRKFLCLLNHCLLLSRSWFLSKIMQPILTKLKLKGDIEKTCF